ncbi:MAG: DEAD/DEAH box helicase family protein [Deltaproteobacteria bacterium]|nr:DEAD/DEAH box helicase family protein [Deltaproteobacteria bacterium]
MSGRRQDLERLLAQQESEVARLERAFAEARAKRDSLRAELASLPIEPVLVRPADPAASDGPAISLDAKVKVFRSLFKGRTDVYPERWTSKAGKVGYSPACANKFVPGVCGLRDKTGKCSTCTHFTAIPVDDDVVYRHLEGKHVIGVYPLLQDETCWFLAADFDKAAWREDVSAVLETSRLKGVPAYVERSRSGNGAHVWIFFSAPLSASSARKLGCHLLTEAMVRRHELGMSSYDRLFPSQDSMPRGGYGNLIALPLQRGPRQEGNSVFLDDRLNPIENQWAFLSQVQRMTPAEVERIAIQATREGSIIGARAEEEDEEALTPWRRSPTRRPRLVKTEQALPAKVPAVLAQRLFIEKAGLPSPLLSQLKRLAAFQNPAFYRQQAMRLSTALHPRVIACFSEEKLHLGLPRGCQHEAEQLLSALGVKLEIDDQRTPGAPLEYRFHGELTPVQEQAVSALLAHDIGIFVAPPGIGKTVVGVYLVARRARSTLVLVDRTHLIDQWREQLSLFLGIDRSEVGQIGGGKDQPNGRLDVATVQSLVRRGEVKDLVASYGHVIVDECHHGSAVSFERLLAEAKARYFTGLTATPQRRDGHHPVMLMQIGPVRYAVRPGSEAAARPFDQRLIVRETNFTLPAGHEDRSIQEQYAALVSDKARNRLILDDVLRALELKRSPILLTERRDHLEYFASQLRGFARHIVVLQGGMSQKKRREVLAQLASIPASEERLLLAIGKFIGEGFDDPRLDTLFLALPISWRGTLEQYSGRLHRLRPGKTEVQIYDYVDRKVDVFTRMFGKRLKGYRAIGYARGEAPLGFAEPKEEARVEYDERALAAAEKAADYSESAVSGPNAD